MVLDNMSGLNRPDPKAHSVVMLKDGSLVIENGMTRCEAYAMFAGLDGSGIQALVTRTSEIAKQNV